jgi:ferredoxin
MTRGVRVDRDRCVASGQCTHFAPNTFALVEGFASVVGEGDSVEDIEEAVESCPAEALSYLDEGDI